MASQSQSQSQGMKRDLSLLYAQEHPLLPSAKRYRPSDIGFLLAAAAASSSSSSSSSSSAPIVQTTPYLPHGLNVLLSSIDMDHQKPAPCASAPALVKPKQSKPKQAKVNASPNPPKSKRSSFSISNLLQESDLSASISSLPPSVSSPAPSSPLSDSSLSASPFSPSSTPPPSSPSLSPAPGFAVLTCYHSTVAQKSYGFEKRFLSPPPLVSMQMGASGALPKYVGISIVGDSPNSPPQPSLVSSFDEEGKACFKYLHVAALPFSKSFHLRLSLSSEPSSPATSPLQTKKITVISKPSKKVANSRSEFSICPGDLVSLFNRINSQTVRTRYLGANAQGFSAKSSSWTAFTIKVVNSEGKACDYDLSAPIAYGQEVVFCDQESGFTSEVFVVRKVVKDVLVDVSADTSPISHLHRVALQSKANPNHFLTISPEGPCTGEELSGTLHYASPKSVNGNLLLHDLMQWTIVGVTKSQVLIPTTSS